MEVILLKRVPKLGQMGDIVNVKPGYARNYLLPHGVADRATEERIKYFESVKTQLEAENLKAREDADKVAAKMQDLMLTFIRTAAETGALYGALSTREISDAVTEAGFTIERRQIMIEAPVKTLGLHTVYVVLHPEVHVPVTLNIALSQEEARAQLQSNVTEKDKTATASNEATVEESSQN